MKRPIILVLSEGQLRPQEIINNLRKIPAEEDNEVLTTNHMNQDVMGYILNLQTKYYKTQLHLVPFEDDISILPPDILQYVECILLYFDSKEKSFSEKIPSFVNFVNDNYIELAIFMCDKLYDAKDCITYKEIKEANRAFDIVELERKRDDDDDDDDEDEHNLHDPLGYDEVMQALRSFLWSNVNINAVMGSKPNNENNGSNSNNAENKNVIDNFNSMEKELEDFEKLLTEMMHFKNNSSTWTRNERLAYMEKFADKFQNLLSDDDDSSTENESNEN